MARTDRVSLAIRIATIVLCSILFVLLLQRDYLVKTLDQRQAAALKRDREESFLGVYFKDQRIGYVKNRLLPTTPNGFTLHQEAFLRLNILNESHPLRMEVTSTMSDDSLLRDFDFTLDSPFYHMTAKGRVEGSRVDLKITTGGETITDSVRLERPPYLATNMRGYLLSQGLATGDKIRVPYFDPVSLAGKDTVMEYRGLDKILLKGRVYNLHHFVETFSGLRINSWLDDKGKVVKEESPAGFVFIAEPEFKATDIGEEPGQELLRSVAVPLVGTLPDPATATEIRYRLTLPPDLELNGLATGRQELDGDVLAVRRELLPGAEAAACAGPADALASTPYVQAKNARISEQAAAISQNAPSAVARVRALSRWVYEHVEKRPVLGIPDALTTLETLRGDCNEHAALFAALARAAGIPTRIVAGVTLLQDAFYYHAWNEVCLDGRWLSIDTTRDQIPADLSHIKFVQGETEAMITITGLIGKLKIEALPAGDGQ